VRAGKSKDYFFTIPKELDFGQKYQVSGLKIIAI